MSAPHKEDPKPIDLESLGEDELDSIEINDDDEIIQEPAAKDEDDKVKDDPPSKKDPELDPDPDKKDPDEKDPEKKPDPDPDPEPDAQKVDDKDPAAKKEPDDENVFSEDDQKEMDRLGGPEKVFKSAKDTRAQLTRAQTEVSTTKKELDDLKAKNLTAEQEKSSEIDSELKAFRALDATEKNDFAQDDPDGFIKMVEADEKQKVTQVDIETTRQNDAHRKMADNLFTFMKDEKKIDVKEDQPGAQKYLDSDEFTELDKELNDNYKRQPDGTFTVRQMKSAFLHVNKDNMLEEERAKARIKTLDDIERAKAGGSPLDRPAKQAGDTQNKDYADLVKNLNSEHPADVDKAMAEIDQFGEQEMDLWEKYNKSVGMS